mmetsp:Transcript_24311/g.79310  ORF Transcript_24311/g.79310 Transcript_24311/m.79310 type:complete len:446 (+) Transcript_24311:255-1592(+)
MGADDGAFGFGCGGVDGAAAEVIGARSRRGARLLRRSRRDAEHEGVRQEGARRCWREVVLRAHVRAVRARRERHVHAVVDDDERGGVELGGGEHARADALHALARRERSILVADLHGGGAARYGCADALHQTTPVLCVERLISQGVKPEPVVLVAYAAGAAGAGGGAAAHVFALLLILRCPHRHHHRPVFALADPESFRRGDDGKDVLFGTDDRFERGCAFGEVGRDGARERAARSVRVARAEHARAPKLPHTVAVSQHIHGFSLSIFVLQRKVSATLEQKQVRPKARVQILGEYAHLIQARDGAPGSPDQSQALGKVGRADGGEREEQARALASILCAVDELRARRRKHHRVHDELCRVKLNARACDGCCGTHIRQHPRLDDVGANVVEHSLDLLGEKLHRHVLRRGHALRVLSSQSCDCRCAIDAESGARLDIGLDACAPAGI